MVVDAVPKANGDDFEKTGSEAEVVEKAGTGCWAKLGADCVDEAPNLNTGSLLELAVEPNEEATEAAVVVARLVPNAKLPLVLCFNTVVAVDRVGRLGVCTADTLASNTNPLVPRCNVVVAVGNVGRLDVSAVDPKLGNDAGAMVVAATADAPNLKGLAALEVRVELGVEPKVVLVPVVLGPFILNV